MQNSAAEKAESGGRQRDIVTRAAPAPVRAASATPAAASPAAAAKPSVHRQRRAGGSVEQDVLVKFLIVPDWRIIAVPMVVGLLLLCLMAYGFPPVGVILLGLVGAAIPPFAERLNCLARAADGKIVRQVSVIGLGVALPLLLFSFAVAMLLHSPVSPDLLPATAVLATMTMLVAVLLTNRPAAQMTGQASLWGGLALTSGSLVCYALVVVQLILIWHVAARQIRLDMSQLEMRQARERVQARAEQLLAEYEETGQGWFWESDRRGFISYVSPNIVNLLGRTNDDITASPLTSLFILDGSGEQGERSLNFHLTARSSFKDLAVRAAIAGDEERWWAISGRPIYDKFSNFMGFRGSGTDLTEQRRSEEHATRLAHFDSLTGLANRFQMSHTLETILNAQHIERRICAVFLLDLDRFKQVNDTMGHPAGDALLKQVAQRLELTVGDAGRVGRLGGDEFQVILPGRSDRKDLANLAQRVIEHLSQPYSIEGHRVVIGASVGIALSPEDGVTSEALIRNADLALYAAKDGGRGRHHFYDADLHSDAEERRQMEQDLRDAIAHGGLELYYQPVVHTTTERITGFEALLRWNHPKHGFLSPARFIPIAEDAGLIAPIGEWALRTACFDLAKWPESVRVAVNVSPLQFANPALPAIITNAIAAAQVNPARLELEITESVFLNDGADTDAMFSALKRVGVRLALDDFGTGYSSLGYLKKAPFDKIKIDQSFVRGATMEGSRNGAIIASIVSLAEALGMETTAEGVETLDELDLIRMLGCSHIQGYIYDKPLSSADAQQRLTTGLTAIAQGPRSARPARHTMLRKVQLENGGELYPATIRNISASGALVEGLWNVPSGTIFTVYLSQEQAVTATTRWCKDDRMGVEFAAPIHIDATGRIGIAQRPSIAAGGPSAIARAAVR